MMDMQRQWQRLRSIHTPARQVGRRQILIGAGTLSFTALLASAGGALPVTAAAQPDGLPIGNWVGDLVVSRVRAWREPEPGQAAGGQSDAFTHVASALQLSGRLTLTVTGPPPDTAPAAAGMLAATWSVRTVKRFSEGRRVEEESNGRLTGGEVLAEADGVTGEPRLIVRGAMWEPGAFPSFTVRSYGPDGSPNPVGDGMVVARAADPLVMVVEWHTPDLIVGSVEADQLRPPRTLFGGGTADPSAQATDLRVMAAGSVTLLRTARR